MRKRFGLFFAALFALSATIGLTNAAWKADKEVPDSTSGSVTATTGDDPIAFFDSRYFTKIEDAVEAAGNESGSKTVYVIPGTSGRNITRSFTIKSNVTLAMTYKTDYSKNGYYSVTNVGTIVYPDSSSMKSKVVINANVEVTIKGKLIVGGSVSTGSGGANNSGCTCGDFAQITMMNGAKLTCDSGSKVTVYGYIQENTSRYGDYEDNVDMSAWSKIELKSGSTLNCPFTIHDFRGGTITTNIHSNASSKHVIYFNEYEMFNVRPLIKVNHGAFLTVDAHVYVYGDQSASDIKLIGNTSDYFFQTKTGSTVYFKYSYGNTANTYSKRYLNFMDIRLDGDFSINALKMSLSVSVDTSNLRFALSYLFHIRIKNGTTSIPYMMKMMPGAQLIVYPTASLSVGDMIIYTNYTDPGGGHTNYPTIPEKKSDQTTNANYPFIYKDARLIVNGSLTATKLAGRIHSEISSASLSVTSNATITSYECGGSSNYPAYTEELSLLFYKGVSVGDTYESAGLGTYYSYKDSLDKVGWFTNSGSIVYNSNGSSSSFSEVPITIDSTGYTITQENVNNTPTRNHYTFDGWCIDKDCTTPALGQVIYSTTTLYAKWTPNDYNIYYHCDKFYDDEPFTNPITNNNPSTFNIDTPIQLNAASSGNYIFDGWYRESTYANKIGSITGDILSELSSPYDLHLYGRWYPEGSEIYTITFVNSNTDEGCTCKESEDVLTANISTFAPPNLSTYNNDKEYNKYFDGWYFDNGTKYTSYTQITESTTLTARWYQKNAVTINMMNVYEEVRYLNKDYTFTVPDLASYNIEIPTGYQVRWLVSGGDLDGQTVQANQQICLSSSWNQTITVTASFVPMEFSLTITVGSNISCVVSVNGVDVTNAIKNTSATITVKTNDQIHLTITRDSGYSNGGAVTNNEHLNGTSPDYTVKGTGNCTINIASASKPQCVLPETLVTMADGSKHEIKDIVAGDEVLAFNHETGELVSAPVVFNEKEEYSWCDVIYLEFSNNKTVGVVSEHGFFDLDTMKYEYIDETNYLDFVGHRFYAVDDNFDNYIVTLDNAYVKNEYVECYELPSFYHLDFFTEDVLSMPGGIKGLFNIFDYGENLQYEQEAYNRDIEMYGLFEYEDLAPLGVTEIMFEAYAGKYLKVALGKGVLTEEYLAYLIDRYSVFTD